MEVTAIFGSSMEVMASVFGESPFDMHAGAQQQQLLHGAAGAADAGAGAGTSGTIFHCADAFVTVVAVDNSTAAPVQVPFELDPKDPVDLLRYQGALARREERLRMRGEVAAQERTRVSLDGGHTYSPPPERQDSVLEGLPPL